MTRSPSRGALAVVALIALSAPAFAHVTLERGTAASGASYRAVLQINHGCGEAATTGIRVRVPDGVVAARPMPKPGWTLATVKGPYATPARLHGSDLREGVREIVWSGGTLPADQYDEFVFVAQVTDSLAPGATAYFPVVQECGAVSTRWDEMPAAGAMRAAGRNPAPGVAIVAAAAAAGDAMAGMHDMAAMPASAASDSAATIKRGDLTIETPWMRATPGGAKVAGGYVKVTNTGTEAERLVGASMPLAARGEVHEMSNVNGVMHMAPVDGGLLIKPGESVELRPGGYHLMFMDLTGPAKEGDTLKGTLVFQRAGAVEVTFRVGGLGAMRAPAGR